MPPVDRCNGVSPTHAAKSLPRLNVSNGGARAAIAVAMIGPIPGMVVNLQCDLIFAGALGDLAVKQGDLLTQVFERGDQHAQD